LFPRVGPAGFFAYVAHRADLPVLVRHVAEELLENDLGEDETARLMALHAFVAARMELTGENEREAAREAVRADEWSALSAPRVCAALRLVAIAVKLVRRKP